MVPTTSVFLWEGKVQLGDEPGIYGDAHFAGTVLKYPITIKNIDPNQSAVDTLTLEIRTSDINIFAGYPGHRITLYEYIEDQTNPYHYLENALQTIRVSSGTNISISASIPQFDDSAFLALSIEVDNTVTPGLYDDFIISKIEYRTANGSIYAKFGFQ